MTECSRSPRGSGPGRVPGRRAVAWLVSAPLAVLGSQVAHWEAYRLVVPGDEARAALLHRTGHGYLEHLPLLAALALACMLVGLLARAVAAYRGRGGESAPAWPFAIVPPAVFVLQEHLERLAHGQVPTAAVREPTFLPGLLLQLPLAALALALAWLLLRASQRVGAALARARQPRAAARPAWRARAAAPARPRPALARGAGERAPPRAA
jgi:hypothetical protein